MSDTEEKVDIVEKEEEKEEEKSEEKSEEKEEESNNEEEEKVEEEGNEEKKDEKKRKKPSGSGWGKVKVSDSSKNKKASKFLGVDQLEQKRKSRVEKMDVEERQALEIPDDEDEDYEYSIQDKLLFYKERECLLLLLEARKLLSSMIFRKEKYIEQKLKEREELDLAKKKKTGRMSVQEIQDMLQSQPEDDDYDMVTVIQDLKKDLVVNVRKNHRLERDLAKLDKKIALLIKNKLSVEEVLAASRKLKKKKNTQTITIDSKKLEHYQDLFYLLQMNPKYLANCIYVINPKELESFLETVILTLFGDAFSPREEFLLLSLFRLTIERELSVLKVFTDFVSGQSETVLPKMINNYNKRKEGLAYLKKTLEPILLEFVKNDQPLHVLDPLQVYRAMINEHEITTGTKSDLDRNITKEQAAENEEVKSIIDSRLKLLDETCQSFVNGIIKSLDSLPYGLRWLCKQLRELCLVQLPETPEEDISKVLVYFVYYRFINTAIVTPDAYDICTNDIQAVARKNLVSVSKVLGKLFNFSKFESEKPQEEVYVPLNDFIERNIPIVNEYISSIYVVEDPEDKLQVNKYMELAQKAKPVIIISLMEIYRTHSLLKENISSIAPEEDDPLRICISELGEPLKEEEISEEDSDRELQLTLVRRFNVDVEEDEEHQRLYAETKELVIPILRMVPVHNSIHRLNLMDVLEAGIKYATENNNRQLQTQINKILENLGRLENAGAVSKNDHYESFVHDVALEVANRSTIREQQRKEVTRLKGTLENLQHHQSYLTDSMQDYEEYLEACKQNILRPKPSKKKKKPEKFSYKELEKKGIIVDSEVPNKMRGRTKFYISSDPESPGVFEVVAKMGALAVEKMRIDLDELLEKHYNGESSLELDQVTLDVNMTIHLINKSFLS
eukprot:TRINITY_DN481_c0_g2_i1.p1 TRINITY_DN481_c0_g2~~TRINITY_DN481_c0_g2_i1.p1  ORF type:complete len:902 (+),score=391.29 TRINITY_DN481_c0_g2_i1:61-2766(+)